MKRLAIAFAALFVLTGPAALAAGRGHDRDRDDGPPGLADKPYGLPPGQAKKLWRRGEHIPAAYIGPRYYVAEPRVYHLAPPPRGHRWVLVEGDAYLVEISTGLIADSAFGVVAVNYGPPPPPVVVVSPEERWHARYAQAYRFEDDRDCHQSVNPGAVIGGAVIGGILGNAVGHGGSRAGTTIAGAVVGGAVGAALTSHLSCEDRGYAYRTYRQGFDAGRANARYEWRNPNGARGELQVRDYYNDPDGFRCAKYTQTIYVNGRPEAATGRACKQPDGTWAIVS
jgi:Ni/Co efflux regulator RcnB/surface antigen